MVQEGNDGLGHKYCIEAIRCFETAIDLDFSCPDVYYFLGAAHSKNNNREDGMKYIEKAAQLGSDYAKQWIAAKVPNVTPRQVVVYLAEKANGISPLSRYHK